MNAHGHPRSLTQMLRDWDDDGLARLLEARPDLAFPPPQTFSEVASRATTRDSVADALRTMNAFDLWVAQRAVAQPGAFSATQLTELAEHATETAKALDRLLALALLWGDESALRPVRALAALLAEAGPIKPALPDPPSVGDSVTKPSDLVDRVAAGSAFEFIRRIDVVVEHCEHSPTPLTRAGALGTRALRLLATLLDLPTAAARSHLEIATSAGLLGVSARGSDDVLQPTVAFDTWQRHSLADQWATVAAGWFDNHPPSGVQRLKRLCFEAYGDPAAGVVLSAIDLKTWLAWRSPMRAGSADRSAAVMLEQASWLGITGLGALSSFGLSRDVEALDRLLPARVGHIVVQADLTAVAPGPLTAEAARDLGALADVESRGGATVYRFSVASLRRAHSLGWSVDD
ncbi:MAG: helicase-associated domain-containing protein, partial [Nocardioidaceae bacterium]